jgi:hypothetical protein
MFEEEPSERAKLIGATLLIAMVIGFLAALFLFVTKWGHWTSR